MSLNPQCVDIFDQFVAGLVQPPWILPTNAQILSPGRDNPSGANLYCQWSYPNSQSAGYITTTSGGGAINASGGIVIGFAFLPTAGIDRPRGTILSVQLGGIVDSHGNITPGSMAYGPEYFSLQIMDDGRLLLVSGGVIGSPPYFPGSSHPACGPPSKSPIRQGCWHWVEINYSIAVNPDLSGNQVVSVTANFEFMGFANDSSQHTVTPYILPTWPGPFVNLHAFFANTGNCRFTDFLVSFSHVSTVTKYAPFYGDSKICPVACP